MASTMMSFCLSESRMVLRPWSLNGVAALLKSRMRLAAKPRLPLNDPTSEFVSLSLIQVLLGFSTKMIGCDDDGIDHYERIGVSSMACMTYAYDPLDGCLA